MKAWRACSSAAEGLFSGRVGVAGDCVKQENASQVENFANDGHQDVAGILGSIQEEDPKRYLVKSLRIAALPDGLSRPLVGGVG